MIDLLPLFVAMALASSVTWALLNAPTNYLVIGIIVIGTVAIILAIDRWTTSRNNQRRDPQWFRRGSQDRSDLAALIETLVNEYRTNREDSERRDHIKYWIERITTFAVIVTVFFVILQWHEMLKVYEPISKQAENTHTLANAALQQVQAMQSQLEATERDQSPYINVDDRTHPPAFLSENGFVPIIWEWHFMNFGKGRAVAVNAEPFMRLGANGLFKRPPGAESPAYVGDMPIGKDNFGKFTSAPIPQTDFNRWLNEPFGISLLVEFHYDSVTGKHFDHAACVVRLPDGGLGVLNFNDCQKSKGQ